MAHSKSALKRWRQNEAHRERNKSLRTASRTAVKRVHAAIDSGATDVPVQIGAAASILDRAAKRGVIHRNAASRHKSRMMRQAARAAAPTATAAAPKKARRASTTTKAAAKPRATKPRTTKTKT